MPLPGNERKKGDYTTDDGNVVSVVLSQKKWNAAQLFLTDPLTADADGFLPKSTKKRVVLLDNGAKRVSIPVMTYTAPIFTQPLSDFEANTYSYNGVGGFKVTGRKGERDSRQAPDVV